MNKWMKYKLGGIFGFLMLAGLPAGANVSIPLTSPYAADRQTVESIPTNAVDWVLVELRNTEGVPVFSQ